MFHALRRKIKTHQKKKKKILQHDPEYLTELKVCNHFSSYLHGHITFALLGSC